VHVANAPASKAHWKVEGVSLPLKLKLAVVALVGLVGDAVIDVVGAVVSIRHVCVAGVGSLRPDASIAVTWKVCVPSASPEYVCGLVHVVAAPPSRHTRTSRRPAWST